MVTDVSLSGSSEYELYYNYILKNHSDRIEIRQLNWKNVNNLNLEVDSESNFDYVSYHWYSRT